MIWFEEKGNVKFLSKPNYLSLLWHNSELAQCWSLGNLSVVFFLQEPDAEFRVLASTLGLCTPHDASSSSTESFSCVSCLKWPRSKPLASIRHWCEALLLSAMQKKTTLTRVGERKVKHNANALNQ